MEAHKQQNRLSRTRIEGFDYVWNPVHGCSFVSAGCEHCWARRFAQRHRGRSGYPADEPFRPTFDADRLSAPLVHRGPGTVAVGWMGDLFHPHFADEQIDRVFAIMGLCGRRYEHKLDEDCPPERVIPGLTFFVLTKRPERMAEYLISPDRPAGWERAIETLFGAGCGEQQDLFDWHIGDEILPPNIWLGTSAENQEWLERRLWHLRECRTRRRFVSLEPLLGPISLEAAATDWLESHAISWVIAGPETGPGARPYKPQWFEAMREECGRSGVPLFIKDAAPEDLRQRQFPVGLEPRGKRKPNPQMNAENANG